MSAPPGAPPGGPPPPPPLVNLNDPKYLPSAEQARQDTMLVVTIAMTVMGTFCVALRAFVRTWVVRNFGPDDWAIVAAAIFVLGLFTESTIAARNYKLGFSTFQMLPEQAVNNMKVLISILVTYPMALTLIKLSILLFYLRIAVVKTFENLCKGTVILVVLFQIISIIVTCTECIPLSKMWGFYNQAPGHCINYNAFYHVSSVFHIVTDFWILALPWKLVMTIQCPRRDKIALGFIFGLGFLSAACSIVRLQYLRIFTLSKDPFYDIVPINIWSITEVNVSLICACLPTLRPLFSKSQRQRTKSAYGRSGYIRDFSGNQGSGSGIGGGGITRVTQISKTRSPRGKEMHSDIDEEIGLNDMEYPNSASTQSHTHMDGEFGSDKGRENGGRDWYESEEQIIALPQLPDAAHRGQK
ncbi:hypothetical protein BCR34DRAFT_36029 [Clohesyomyces aquaticus]|uniref:Rhodopsin domain-containing protein n=1 Tax=Clohesyomyces aquaticus TaxID=1231657 RepID=A0A1Y1Z776_9PLEO|nr:hypothetical protein BCR34DRAFT_36029 [Clohesyomyces aquaticus]